MGLIEKSVRQRGNQKLAAPAFTNTRLPKEEVRATVEKICGELTTANIAELREARAGGLWKSSKVAGVTEAQVTYYVETQGHKTMVGFFARPTAIQGVAPKARLKKNQAYWLAEVVFMKETPETPPGQLVVRLTLVKWVIDQDGKLKNRDKYELFAERLHEAISVDA